MKEVYFFRHDFNARNDHKTSALISDHGAAGYGIYWCLIEMMHEEPTHKLPLQDFFFRSCAKQTSTSVEQVLNTVQDCLNIYQLFSSESGFFYSERVFRNIQEREEIREKRSIAGKISAEKRKNSTGAEQVLNKGQQIKGNKRKGKKIKEDNKSLSQQQIIDLELSELDNDNIQRWHKFSEWFKGENLGNVSKITKQLTPVQLINLLQDYGASDIKDTLLRMENYKKVSNYESVYLTLKNWLKKEAANA